MGVSARLSPRWRLTAKAALHGLVDLAVPRACIVCGAGVAYREPGLVCGACWSRVPLLPKPQCARCGHPLQRNSGVLQPSTVDHPPSAFPCVCDQLAPTVRLARSVCWIPHTHSTPLLAALKYQGWWGIADAMAERMVRTGRDLLDAGAVPRFVPVPLADARLRERGYNQSEHLAQALARRTGGVVMPELLARARATTSQTQLTPAERRANVHGAFVVPTSREAAVRGRAFVLVDDVLTTGATLNACAVALLDGGASDIRYWTFGRARRDADRP